jgi:hypothetical protein
MAKFCPKCGTPYEEPATFCTGCGNSLSAPAAPAAAGSKEAVKIVKQYLKIIIAVVAAFALLMGILNLFGTYNVTAEAEFYGYKDSTSVALSELREDAPDEAMMFVLSSYIIGLVALAVGGLEGYSFYLLHTNAPGSKKFFSLGALIGTIGSAVALLMALFGSNIEYMGVEMSMSVNFSYWLVLILSGAMLYLDKFLLKNDYAPLQ